tara:strand:+ start:87 stop:242 length:156 start_codon:yes stop_codon:yes gene_type:complete
MLAEIIMHSDKKASKKQLISIKKENNRHSSPPKSKIKTECSGDFSIKIELN